MFRLQNLVALSPSLPRLAFEVEVAFWADVAVEFGSAFWAEFEVCGIQVQLSCLM